MVEALVPLIFFPPLASQQPLGFQPAEQRVQSAFIDLQAMGSQRLSQCVTVMLLMKLGQHRENQTSPAQFEAKIFEEIGVHGLKNYVAHSVLCTLYGTQLWLSRGKFDRLWAAPKVNVNEAYRKRTPS